MWKVDTEAFVEVDGVKRYGKIGDRWLKDMDREELHALVLRLAYALEGEKQAHEETLQLASARCCAG
jgi:hypothetical protein